MEMRLPPDFRDFLALLNSAKIEYLLVGGYAVGYHGYPRPTGDLDIWIDANTQTAEKLKAVLINFGFPAGAIRAEQFTTENQVFRMGVPPVRIELLTGITGVQFRECYPRRIDATLDGVDVRLINREDLLKNKLAAGRHKDLNDAEQLAKKRT